MGDAIKGEGGDAEEEFDDEEGEDSPRSPPAAGNGGQEGRNSHSSGRLIRQR